MRIISASDRLMQEVSEANVGYTARLYLKKVEKLIFIIVLEVKNVDN